MKKKIELVFFSGCPNVMKARETIRASGTLSFAEIEQDRLPLKHPYLRFSSPTILADGKIVGGSENSAAACSMIDWNGVALKLAALD
jgi:hypothetical protein